MRQPQLFRLLHGSDGFVFIYLEIYAPVLQEFYDLFGVIVHRFGPFLCVQNIADFRSGHADLDAQLLRLREHRLHRIRQQFLEGTSADDACCVTYGLRSILIQIAAVERALQSFGYIILQEHMETCMVEDIKEGRTETIEEVFELIKKLK